MPRDDTKRSPKMLAAMFAEGLLEPWEAPTRKRRKPRRPTLTRALKQAARAGQAVAGATIMPDGAVQLQFGDNKHEPGNELDQWMAKRAH